MLEFPFAVHFHVIVLVACRDPARLVVFAKSKWAQEVPSSFGAAAVDFDSRVEDVMLRECDQLFEALEQFADRGRSLSLAEASALPYTVVDEDLADPVGIVIVVAKCRSRAPSAF